MAEARAEEKRVCVGAVAGAFGVRGEARIKPFTDDPDKLGAYGPLETEDGARRFSFRPTRAVKGGVAGYLTGVATREQAEALKGVRLYVPRSALPPPEDEDEFYHADLIGMTAVALDGAPLGRVKSVQNFGAGDVLEIEPAEGGRTALLPFTRETAPEIDMAGRRIVLDPPEGVFDEDEAPERKPRPPRKTRKSAEEP